MYKRYLDKFDLKLLTKLQKKGFVPVLGGEKSVNHVPIDTNLRVTYVYCVSSLTPNHEETSEYFVLNKFYGKYYTYFNIIFIILRFITDKKFQWSLDVSDPTYLNGCTDSSSSLIISKSVGETQISDSQESKKNLEDKSSDSNIDGKFKFISK